MQEPCKKSYCHDEGYNVQFLLQLFQKGVDSMPFLKREFVVGLYCIIPKGVFHICPMLVYIDWVDKILETHLRNKKKTKPEHYNLHEGLLEGHCIRLD